MVQDSLHVGTKGKWLQRGRELSTKQKRTLGIEPSQLDTKSNAYTMGPQKSRQNINAENYINIFVAIFGWLPWVGDGE